MDDPSERPSHSTAYPLDAAPDRRPPILRTRYGILPDAIVTHKRHLVIMWVLTYAGSADVVRIAICRRYVACIAPSPVVAYHSRARGIAAPNRARPPISMTRSPNKNGLAVLRRGQV